MLKRFLTILFLVVAVLGMSSGANAQYMRILTDNPTDNTRLRATGTTILTISVDTNHDKNGTIQTCNSHQVAAGCPFAVGTAQPLDMFGYTIALKAVGGTVQFGTFTASDANYTNSSPQIQNDTEVEVNQFRPTGTFTPPGPATLGTIPVTPLTGTPAVNLKVGYSQPTDLNPAGFGTGFATECDGTQNFNYYIVGDPNDPCGANPSGPRLVRLGWREACGRWKQCAVDHREPYVSHGDRGNGDVADLGDRDRSGRGGHPDDHAVGKAGGSRVHAHAECVA